MPELTLVVYGLPAPQGSKRYLGHSAKGAIRMAESSKHVKPWRDDVRTAALTAIGYGSPGGLAGGFPLDGPLVVRMVFTFTRPKSHYRTGRNAHLLRDGAPARPASLPDLSKLLRSTEDALTSAGVWTDDARLVEYQRAAKVYVGADPEALDAPGARITIRTLTVQEGPQ